MTLSEKTVLDGLSKGIQAELSSYVFYKKSLEIVKDDKVRDMLKRLASDEKEHYKILEGQYDSLVRTEMWNTISDVLRQEGLPDIEENMEKVHDELIEEISSVTTPSRILEIAYILEERARNIYADLLRKVDDPRGKKTYEYLMKFETGHMNKVKSMMKVYK